MVIPAKTEAKPSDHYRTPNDPALLYAWGLFVALDDKSNQQKNSHMRVRNWVIFFLFMTSVLAVLTTVLIPPADNPYRPLFENIFTVLLVALPIATAGMMSYGLQFTPTLAWILYRFSGESIRKEIYLYRMQAAEYGQGGIREKQTALVDAVRKACMVIDDLESPVPFLQAYNDPATLAEIVKNRTDKHPNPQAPAPKTSRGERILHGITRIPVIGTRISGMIAYWLGIDHQKVSRLAGASPYDLPEAENGLTGDDGFSSLTLQQYIHWRLLPQRDWYVSRFNRDYAKFRSSRIFILILGGIGSILAVGGSETQRYIVISTACVVAFSTYVQFRMYGQTYANYHRTAQEINEAIARWSIPSDASQSADEQASRLVTDSEMILQRERNVWSQAAIQVQTGAEDALNKRVEELKRQTEATDKNLNGAVSH